MDQWKLAAVVMTVPFALAMIAGYYYAVYSRYVREPNWFAGKRYSANIQGGLLSWSLAITFAYVLTPVLSGSDIAVRGFCQFFFGTGYLAAGLCGWHTLKVVPNDKRRYQYTLAGGTILGGLGLFSQGLPWMLGLPVYPFLGLLGLLLALLLFGACEVWFLRANGWQFLPTDPK